MAMIYANLYTIENKATHIFAHKKQNKKQTTCKQ